MLVYSPSELLKALSIKDPLEVKAAIPVLPVFETKILPAPSTATPVGKLRPLSIVGVVGVPLEVNVDNDSLGPLVTYIFPFASTATLPASAENIVGLV